MAQNNNPFAQVADAFKSFEAFKPQFPSTDLSELASIGRRNFEEAQKINQVFAEGMQNTAKRAFEIAQANTEAAINVAKEIAGAKDPREAAEKQANNIKKIVDKSISDTNEIVGLASKANAKVSDIVGKQISKNIKECCKVVPSANKKSAA